MAKEDLQTLPSELKVVFTKQDALNWLSRSQKNPKVFNTAVWGNWGFPYDKQWEIWNSVVKHRRTAVKSAHGVGKSFIAARIGLWWTFSHPNSILVATAPTLRQIEKVFFGEIHKQYHKARVELGGKLLQMEIRVDPNWYAIGVTTQKTAQSDIGSKMQGFHAAGGVMVIIDEGANVDDDVFEASESITTGENDRILTIGNPTDPNGAFARAFKSPPPGEPGGWSKLTITAFDVIDLGIPGLVSNDWVEDKRVSWGEESSTWKAKVLGSFPEEGADTLVGYKHIEAALQRKPEDLKDPIKEKTLGIDIARFGNDASVGYSIINGVAKCVFKLFKADVNHVTAQIDAHLRNQEEPYDKIVIEADGIGGGIVDNLKALRHKNIYGIHSGSNPIDRKKYYDKKTELYFALRERLMDGNICLDNETTGADISSIKYEMKVKAGFGVFKLEEKDKTRRRLGRSTDLGDALAFAVGGNLVQRPVNIRLLS